MSVNYATKEAFNTYIDYLALKKHFTSDKYDYLKYNGKVKASFDKFQTRNDAFFFYKLSNKKNSHHIILANMLKDQKVWVRDLCDENAEEVYFEWKKKMDSITYHVQSQLSQLDDDYKSNFVVKSGNHPHLMTLFLQRRISLETFTILSHLSNVFTYWSDSVVDKFIAYDIMRLSRKYYPFLEFDKEKIKKIVKDRFF